VVTEDSHRHGVFPVQPAWIGDVEHKGRALFLPKIVEETDPPTSRDIVP